MIEHLLFVVWLNLQYLLNKLNLKYSYVFKLMMKLKSISFNSKQQVHMWDIQRYSLFINTNRDYKSLSTSSGNFSNISPQTNSSHVTKQHCHFSWLFLFVPAVYPLRYFHLITTFSRFLYMNVLPSIKYLDACILIDKH